MYHRRPNEERRLLPSRHREEDGRCRRIPGERPAGRPNEVRMHCHCIAEKMEEIRLERDKGRGILVWEKKLSKSISINKKNENGILVNTSQFRMVL